MQTNFKPSYENERMFKPIGERHYRQRKGDSVTRYFKSRVMSLTRDQLRNPEDGFWG
jgi:hypothetical protein